MNRRQFLVAAGLAPAIPAMLEKEKPAVTTGAVWTDEDGSIATIVEAAETMIQVSFEPVEIGGIGK